MVLAIVMMPMGSVPLNVPMTSIPQLANKLLSGVLYAWHSTTEMVFACLAIVTEMVSDHGLRQCIWDSANIYARPQALGQG